MKLTKKVKTVREVSFLALNIKFIRKVNGLTQEEFGRKFKVSRSIIGAYEEDRAKPPYDFLINVSTWANVTIDDMLKREISTIFHKSND